MITLNGRLVNDADELSLAELLARENYMLSIIAVACNGEVVPKTTYNCKQLTDGDVIDVVRMVAGG